MCYWHTATVCPFYAYKNKTLISFYLKIIVIFAQLTHHYCLPNCSLYPYNICFAIVNIKKIEPSISAVCILFLCANYEKSRIWHAFIGGLTLTSANNLLCLFAFVTSSTREKMAACSNQTLQININNLIMANSFAIILKRKKKLFALLSLSYRYIVTINVLWLFLTVPLVGLQCLIVVFSGHTYFLLASHTNFVF